MRLAVAPDGRTLDLTPAAVAVVGYAGRDRAVVQAHIEELAAHGVEPPAEVPAVWALAPSALAAAGWVATHAPGTSGEAEPVLVRQGGEWFLSLGSDHTDRELEKTSMVAAKNACPKVLASECVALDEVAATWDALRVRAWIDVDGDWQLYQDGRVGLLQPLAWYRGRFDAEPGDLVVFCGTVPTVGGLVTGSPRFRAELLDADGTSLIVCEYELASSGQTGT